MTWAPPVAVMAVVLLAWDLAVRWLGLPPYLVPSPATVAGEIVAHASELAAATAVTGMAALAGFLVSLVLGVIVACAFAEWRGVARSFYPYAIFLQTVPIVAIAPLIVIWSGPGLRSIVIVTCIVGIFPIITSTTVGLTTVDRDLEALFDVHDASRLARLWKLRLPHALPHLVAGAQAAGGLSVVGAIAGEVFAGYGASSHGLGYLILLTSGQLKTAYLFGAVLACTLLGLAVFATLTVIGDVVGGRRGGTR